MQFPKAAKFVKHHIEEHLSPKVNTTCKDCVLINSKIGYTLYIFCDLKLLPGNVSGQRVGHRSSYTKQAKVVSFIEPDRGGGG